MVQIGGGTIEMIGPMPGTVISRSQPIEITIQGLGAPAI
jgi:hypothetical protein